MIYDFFRLVLLPLLTEVAFITAMIIYTEIVLQTAHFDFNSIEELPAKLALEEAY